MKTFGLSAVVTVVCLGIALACGGPAALVAAAILGVMEVSLSLDNAVVNASILQEMDEKWQKRFLTWGMLIAVAGMRLIIPIVIVAVVAHLGLLEVARLIVQQPAEYAHHLEQAHVSISAFGGMFLLLVFLNFLLDQEKDVHWISFFEIRLAAIGKVDAIQVVLAGGLLLGIQAALPMAMRLETVVAGLAGILLYLLVDGLSALTGESDADGDGVAHVGEALGSLAKRTGVMAFLYLEVLDASFSFDGVIGAFAITRDVVVITMGLAIGAMFVRSLTIFLIRQGALKQFIFLEHGAHYGIGTLAILMLVSIKYHLSEMMTGLVGVAFILAALASSVYYNHKHCTDEPGVKGNEEPTIAEVA